MILFDLVQGAIRGLWLIGGWIQDWNHRRHLAVSKEQGAGQWQEREGGWIAPTGSGHIDPIAPSKRSGNPELERDGGADSGPTTEPTAEICRMLPAPTAQQQSGQVVSRYGEGFSVSCHFYRLQSRVTRTLWLDYARLQRKHGAFVVRRLRARTGSAVRRLQEIVLYAGEDQQHSWGRIALPDAFLEFDSLQDLRVIRLLEKSVEEATALIEEEIPDDLLNKRPWRLLPAAASLDYEPPEQYQRRQTVELSMEHLRSEDAARRKSLSSEDKQYPGLIPAPVPCSHFGVLRNVGYMERKDRSGRTYRTFFADLDEGERTLRHTGVDLQRALLRQQVEVGDRVEIFNLGLVPVGNGRYKKKIWSARKLAA